MLSNYMNSEFNLIEYLTVKRDKGIIIWLCNIGAERYWNTLSTGMVDKQEDVIVNRIEEMNLLICRAQDVMILRENPDYEYLKALKEMGFEIPRILVLEDPDLTTPISELVLKDTKVQKQLREIAENNREVYFIPYAVTYLEEQIAEICDLELIGASSKVNGRINDKVFNREIAEKMNFPVCMGKVCSSSDEVREEYYRLIDGEPAFNKVIIKEPWGASGKGLYIIEDRTQFELKLRIISRFAKNNPDARWLVEGWYEKKADINYQIYISNDGSVNVFSIKQQLLNDTVYIGSKIPPDIREEDIIAYKNYGEQIGKHLFSLGYTGIASIDSFITKQGMIIPIVEINGRFTLSTYISFLNNVIGDKKIVTRYYRVITDSPKMFGDIKKMLSDEGVYYDTEKKEGVIVYTSATLPSREIQGYKGYMGRIFALISATDDDQINNYINRLEYLVSNQLINR